MLPSLRKLSSRLEEEDEDIEDEDVVGDDVDCDDCDDGDGGTAASGSDLHEDIWWLCARARFWVRAWAVEEGEPGTVFWGGVDD